MASVSLQIIVWLTIIFWSYPTQGDNSIDTGIAVLGHDSQHVVVQKNAKLLLNCSVSSQYGNPSITWKKNGVYLDLADNHIQMVQNGSLYFKKFYHKKKKNITDEGIYECYAKNRKGTILARRVKLEVAGIARSFSLQPQDTTVVQGGVARFQCQIKASPPPLYFWLKEGELLNRDSRRHVFISTGILQILDTVPDDAGHYQCTATPGKLHDLPDQVEHFKWKRSEEALLTVTSGNRMRPPVIVAGPQNTTVVEGQSAVLECLVDGNPKPTVTWMRRDGTNILGSGGVIYGATNLKILEVKSTNSDVYYCNASSPGFPAVTAKATLNVQTRPVIRTGPKSVKYPAAHSTRFVCEVSGKPRPRLQWLKNGQDIRNVSDASYKIRNSELVITGTVPNTSGYFQCLAANVVDYAMQIGRLEVFAVYNAPSPPSEVHAEAKSSTEILVMWNNAISRNKPLLAYSVDVQETKNPSRMENYVVQSDTHKLVTGLKPYTFYSVFVRAYNNEGASHRSEVKTVRTLEDVPTAAPMIRVRNTKPTSIAIEWDELPRIHRNGVIIGYRIFYKKEGDETIKVEKEEHGSARSFVIKDLEPSTTYKMRVQAGTKIGFPILTDDKWHWVEDTTPPVAVSNLSVPMPPSLEVIAINTTAVNITWIQDTHGIPVTMYTLTLRRLDDPASQQQVKVQPRSNSHIFTELENDTHYQVSLVAKNQNGPSGPVIQEFLTEENPAPPSPRDLKALTIDSRMIHLTWVQPVSSVKIKQYIVRYQALVTGEAGSNEAQTIESSSNSAVIQGLRPYTYYDIDVKARSDYSDSKYSQSIVERTKEDRPSEPRNLQVVFRREGGLVVIKWNPPAQPNGNITTYIVMISPNGVSDQDEWKSMKVNGSLTTAKIKDLHGGTYYIKIMACTKAGPGPSSNQIEVLTIAQNPPETQPQSPSSQIEDQKLGIILGVTIGVVCIIICILIIMLRNKCFSHAYPHTQPVHSRGNGHMTGYHGNGHVMRHDRELHEMEPYTPMLTKCPENHHLDSKGCGSGNLIVTPNGSRVNGYVPFSNGLRNGHAHNGHVTSFMSSANQAEETKGLLAAMMAASDGSRPYHPQQTDQYKQTVEDKTSLDDIDRSSESGDKNDVTVSPSLPQSLACPDTGHTNTMTGTNSVSIPPQESFRNGGVPVVHTSTGLDNTKHNGRPPDCNHNNPASTQQHTAVSTDHVAPTSTEEGVETQPPSSLPHGTSLSSKSQPSTSSQMYPSPPPTHAVSTSPVGGGQEAGTFCTSGDSPTFSSHQPNNLSINDASRGGSGDHVNNATHHSMSNQGEEPRTTPKHKSNGRANKEHYHPQQPPPPPYPGRQSSKAIPQDNSTSHQKQSSFSPMRQLPSNCRDIEV